jgi:hypothetical protein
MDFRHSQRALEFALKNNIRELQIAVKFIDSSFDETAPLPAPAPYFHPMSLT